MPATESFQKTSLASTPIRNLGLTIKGTRLEPILDTFETELRGIGIRKLRPHYYLSTEWGVPFDTISIAIPFYLARPDLTELHAERIGHVEGFNRADILRYLRHDAKRRREAGEFPSIAVAKLAIAREHGQQTITLTPAPNGAQPAAGG